MAYKIFVDFALSPEALSLLQEGTQGHTLVFPEKPIASVLAKPERDPRFATADIAFGQPLPEDIRESTQLKWVHVSTSGITRYDNAEFRSLLAKRRILMSNSASVYNEACAVHAMSFILAQARQLPASLRTRVGNGDDAWRILRGSTTTLRGETVLILGYGAIGKRLAELLQPFGVQVIACRRNPRGDEHVRMISTEELPRVLSKDAVHVVNILPDNPETRHFFNTERFAQMRPGAVFYNIGRGTTVDQSALLAVLRSGHLAAAWLDVTDPEPLPEGHPLLGEPHCYITPHVAGGHLNEALTLVNHFLQNFHRFVQGEDLLDPIV